MPKIEKKNLGFLGPDYQYKLVNAFITDHKFFKDIYGIIEHNAFTETCLRGIVGIMKDYYATYEAVPSYEMIAIKLGEKLIHNDEDKQYYDETVDKIKHISPEGREEIESLGMRFFQQQEVILRANEIVKAAASGADIDELASCQKKLEEAVMIKRHTIDVTSPFDSIDDDLSEDNVVSIPTGIEQLDKALGGGLDKGKIGLIIGPTGFGKTSITTCFAANASICKIKSNDYQGFKVLQIVFEDSPRDIHRKYIGKITQIEAADLNKDEETTERARDILYHSEDRKMQNENVRIMRLETGEYSATDIKKKIKDIINEGFKPDLLIIDYFECLAPEAGTSKLDVTEREQKTMRKLENMAPELDLAIWLPTQGNRDSLISEKVTMDKMGGSIKKGQIAQVTISISKSEIQKKENRANIELLKNRGGKDTVTLNNVYFNNGTSTIICNDTVDFDEDLGFTEYDSDREKELQKEMIRKARAQYKLHQN